VALRLGAGSLRLRRSGPPRPRLRRDEVGRRGVRRTVGSVRGSPRSRWTQYESVSRAWRAYALDIVLGERRESPIEGVSPTHRAEWMLEGNTLPMRRVHETAIGNQPGEGGQEHPVDTAQLRASGLPLQHRSNCWRSTRISASRSRTSPSGV